MSQYTDKLTTMVKEAPDQVANIDASIASVETAIDDLEKERDAIQNGITTPTTASATDIIDNIIAPDKSGVAVYGSEYGQISWSPLGNLTDWVINDSTTGLPVYTYIQGDYPDLDELVDDFAFGNDYITRPQTTGATYGLNPGISSLNSAVDLLNENADKVADSVDVFNRYAT